MQALCLSSAMHGLAPLDGAGRPLGPLLTWADLRGAPVAHELLERGLAAGLAARTGTPVHPMSSLVKLRALGARAAAGAPLWGGVKEVMLGLLVDGRPVADLSTASSSGLYDIHRRVWDAEALALAGLREAQLPEVVATTATVGVLRPEVADAVGLPRGLPVVAGATDGPLANLGVGAVRPGVAALSVGTSAALRVVVRTPGTDEAGALFCYALTEDRWVIGGAVNNGGSVLDWAEGALGSRDPEALLVEAAAVPAGADGLVCLPYLLGERAPWWRADLTGAFLGLRRDHGRGHLVRALVEGVCQQLALVRESMPGVHQVRATGGAVESPLWQQLLADALDLPVGLAASPEGSGLGACLLGWHALGALPDLDAAAELVPVANAVRPDPAAAEHYRRVRPLLGRAAAAVATLVAGSSGD